jgi:hypothetical protein
MQDVPWALIRNPYIPNYSHDSIIVVMDLDWLCTGVLKVRHPCLMWTFMNYLACGRSIKVLVSTSDLTPLIPGQNRVVLVSSVITKIFNSMQVLDGHISTFWMTLLFYSELVNIIACASYSSFSCVQCYSFSYSLFNFVIQYSYCSVNIRFWSWKCVPGILIPGKTII